MAKLELAGEWVRCPGSTIPGQPVGSGQEGGMRITVDIDDELYAQALRLAGQDLTPDDLIREALETFVRVQAAKRLAALGGTTAASETGDA